MKLYMRVYIKNMPAVVGMWRKHAGIVLQRVKKKSLSGCDAVFGFSIGGWGQRKLWTEGIWDLALFSPLPQHFIIWPWICRLKRDIWLNQQTLIRGAVWDTASWSTSKSQYYLRVFLLCKLPLLIFYAFSKWQGTEPCGEHEMENAICHGYHPQQHRRLKMWIYCSLALCQENTMLLQVGKTGLFCMCTILNNAVV